MQIELVETNSLGHSDQIGNVLQPTFTSRQSGSNEKILIWPRGANSFKPSPLGTSPEMYGATSALEDTVIPNPVIRRRDDTLNQQYSRRGMLDGSTSRACTSIDRYMQPSVFAPNRSYYQPQPPRVMLPDPNQAAVAGDTSSTIDDFIELDLCCRSIPSASDGDVSDHEFNPLRQLQSTRHFDMEPLAGPSRMCGQQRTNAQQVASDRSNESRHSTEACISLREASDSPSRLVDCTNSDCAHQSAFFTCNGTRRTRSSSPNSHLRGETASGMTDSAPFDRLSSDSPSSFYSPLQSSTSSSSSSSCIFRPPIDAIPSFNHASVTDAVSGPMYHDPNPTRFRYTPTPSAGVSMNNLCQARSLMLLPTSELASGGSLTCTVVNILRGLRLLHRCGLEDLCASLYGLWNVESDVASTHRSIFNGSSTSRPDTISCSTDPSAFNHLDSSVIRSSSFTSAALISPRRSTVPRDYSQNGNMGTHILGNGGLIGPTATQNNCLVNFILTCSRLGSSLLFASSTGISGPGSGPSGSHAIGSCAALPSYLPGADWRRGCASNLVNLLTSRSITAPKSPRSTVSRLITGRFLMGPHTWRSVWPYSMHGAAGKNHSTTHGRPLSEELIHWISAWIRHGAVIVLAQQVVPSNEPRSLPSAASELLWCHRVVCGVSQHNEIYLSNPVELVPVDDILRELSRQTTISLAKSTLSELWIDHLSYMKPSFSVSPELAGASSTVNVNGTSGSRIAVNRLHPPSMVTSPDRSEEDAEDVIDNANADDGVEEDQLTSELTDTGIRSHPHQSCVGDFSLLACQPDPRWNQMNVLGQVIQTLRGLDNIGAGHGPLELRSSISAANFSLERSSLSSTIVIPCAESPGFSLFVPKTDWELVHALYTPPSFIRSSH